ncbi:hypothetical protein BH23ACT11_BH23ACT11_12700 [soil metagenome]
MVTAGACSLQLGQAERNRISRDLDSRVASPNEMGENTATVRQKARTEVLKEVALWVG